MSFVDREIVCLDCTQSFVFTAGEQEFYERKGFKEEPKRCKVCRETRKQRRNDAPVTARAPRPAAEPVNANGFGFRGTEDRVDAAPDPETLGNRAFTDDAADDDIGNRAPGQRPAPARPRMAAPRPAANAGARRERSSGGGEGAERRERLNGGADRRELHDATCAQCNGVARVPFKPVPGRPVYCRDCYASRAASAGGR